MHVILVMIATAATGMAVGLAAMVAAVTAESLYLSAVDYLAEREAQARRIELRSASRYLPVAVRSQQYMVEFK